MERAFATRRRAYAWAAALSVAGAWPHLLFSLAVATPIIVGFAPLAIAVWIPAVGALGVYAIRGRDAPVTLLWAVSGSYIVTAVVYLLALPILAWGGSDEPIPGLQWLTMLGFYLLSTLSGAGAAVAWRASVRVRRDPDWT